MPELGEIRKGGEIGHKLLYTKLIWRLEITTTKSIGRFGIAKSNLPAPSIKRLRK